MGCRGPRSVIGSSSSSLEEAITLGWTPFFAGRAGGRGFSGDRLGKGPDVVGRLGNAVVRVRSEFTTSSDMLRGTWSRCSDVVGILEAFVPGIDLDIGMGL